MWLEAIKILKTNCLEYMDISTIHGPRFLTEPNRSRVEKVFWFIMIVFTIFGCGVLIADIWIKYEENPLVVSIEETATPVWQVPFPAVTVCSEAKSDRRLFDFSKFLEPFIDRDGEVVITNSSLLLDDVNRKHELLTATQLCDALEFKHTDPMHMTDCSQCLNVMRRIVTKSFLGSCSFMNNSECLVNFAETVTDEGICYTFNSLDMQHIFRMENLHADYTLLHSTQTSSWSLEDGYEAGAPLTTFPYRSLAWGVNEGLHINLMFDPFQFDPVCKSSYGFRIAIHAPNEIAHMTKFFQKMPLNHEVNIMATPNMVTTDESLRSYSPYIRNCFFNNERYLRYFKVYTQLNCKMECLTNSTLATCGCVQFYMPRGHDVKVCGLGEMACAKRVQKDVSVDENNNYECNCWPSCAALTYTTVTTQEKLPFSKVYLKLVPTRNVFLNIMVNQEHFYALRRAEIYGSIDLISQFGGLLGLFMGISLLSILEIFYFWTLRLCCTFKMTLFSPSSKIQPEPSPSKLVKPWVEYSANSSIHGFPYLVKRERPPVERAFWATAIIISIIGCGSLITNLHTRWTETPVLISLSEKATPIWQIPFPAITICPEDKSDTKKFDIENSFRFYYRIGVDKLQDNLEDGILRSRLMALSQVCNDPFFFVAFRPSNCSDCLKVLRAMALSKESIFNNCQYQHLGDEDCDGLFHETITDVGVCYTFNALKMSDIFRDETITKDFSFLNHSRRTDQWSMDGGYTRDASLLAYPFRALGVGAKMGLSVVLIDNMKNFARKCSVLKQGFRFMLHAPSDIPQLSKYGHKLPVNQEVIVTIRPKMMVTDESLRSYPAIDRQCFYSNERPLRYFKVYTQQNCFNECFTNLTLEICGCIHLSMPRHVGVRVCSTYERSCLKYVEYNFNEKIAQQEQNNVYNASNCNCWPTCTSISYETEITHVELEKTDEDYEAKDEDNDDEVEEAPTIRLTSVVFLFKQEQLFAFKRSELFGQTDFIANCGGLLGLLMGVSLLSFVEFGYFLTIRLICTWKMQRKEQKTIMPQVLQVENVEF